MDQRRLAITCALFGARARSLALQRGDLRWLYIGDDAFPFLREAPGETVLVHAAQVDHRPTRLPTMVVGSEFVGLAGALALWAGPDSVIALPADGPAFGMWRLTDV